VITQVDSDVWRGPRPEPAEFEGIKNKFACVISLEGSDEDQKESRELAPVPVISETISTVQIYLTGISQNYLDEILGAIRMEKKPVLVHCQHGQDRTGLVIAAYRVNVHGWSKGQAMSEALAFGYRSWLNFGLNRTWRQFQCPSA
jgi:hypothetical protein